MASAEDIAGIPARDRRRQLPDEVAAYVREQIMSGNLRPGDFLRMEPIAAAVGVSNTPVREGLLRLSSEGFVTLVPRRGFVVAPFTRQDVTDLFWALGQLVGELAARTAEHITPEQIARLEAIEDRFDQAIADQDGHLIAELGHAFHREINLAADSHRLALVAGGVAKHLPNHFYATLESQVTESRSDHRAIIDALRDHDGDKARAAMRSHMARSAEHVVTILEERGLWA
ncbi:GntR family transcriptional regulator [Jongsikchunia kroppenstedtii]|uniref:GntR family transcriptional regulator n=1 Tax=Jongsikchunia kroppenstedtii TaxID=1121721 RepID=UPI00035E756B|nr:GntR family transcriptional regulator [Jongsikchunia kroppenstedtii]